MSRLPTASAYLQRGMANFRRNLVAESVCDFDACILVDASYKPKLWQRGLSLFYLNRFADAAAQFALDVSLNPNDTEESIWHFLSMVQLYREGGMSSMDAMARARSTMLIVGIDSRPVMRQAMALFHPSRSWECNESDLDAVGTSSLKDRFYADLYLGLYAEAKGDEESAKGFMVRASQSGYGAGQEPDAADYMWYLANVHVKHRGW